MAHLCPRIPIRASPSACHPSPPRTKFEPGPGLPPPRSTASNSDQHSPKGSLRLVVRRLCIRQGSFPKSALPGRRRFGRKEIASIMRKLSTDDKTAGKIHEVTGAIKQTAGQLTNNPSLEANGRTEKNAGKVQNFVGKVEKAVGA